MPKILVSDFALYDLEDIWSYIAEDNTKAADALYNKIQEKFHKLAEAPQIGRNRPEIGEGIRSFPIGNYVVFYRIVSEGVYISRVLHGKRDILTTLDSEE